MTHFVDHGALPGAKPLVLLPNGGGCDRFGIVGGGVAPNGPNLLKGDFVPACI